STYYQRFLPSLAGRGTSAMVTGAANGCSDSIVIEVYNRAKIQKDTQLCIADPVFRLLNNEGSGTFSGKGIVNQTQGLFRPSSAGVGTHIILFDLPGRCTDTVRITVTSLPNAQIQGLSNTYCFKNTAIALTLRPFNGVLSGPGTYDSFFNPALAGTGWHQIRYTAGSGSC